jgi:hypothetical protein
MSSSVYLLFLQEQIKGIIIIITPEQPDSISALGEIERRWKVLLGGSIGFRREREKVEMEIRAARPSSPRARCAREEWEDTGLRVREWLLERVQAAGVGCRV